MNARDSEGGARDPEGGARDPQAEAAVARLLAEVGGSVPMPADVAARLDDVLAGLERERAGGSTAAVSDDVVELRTRRRWPRLVLAAAAVVVGGYSVGTVLTQGTLSGSSETSSAASAGSDTMLADKDAAGRNTFRGDRDRPEGGGEAATEGGAETQDYAPHSSRTKDHLVRLGAPVRLSSDELQTGVRRALRILERPLSTTAQLRGADALKRAQERCPGPELGPEHRSLLVRYDGARAVLVAGPEQKGAVEVTVFSCSGSELVATVVRR